MNQADVVGMAVVAGVIWITHWGAHEVGTWDPLTNLFTPVFGTPANAGGLAYDPTSDIMWVGLGGGQVVPYTLAGIPLNAGFQPFGDIPDTIDGMAFIFEQGPPLPLPGTLALIFAGLFALLLGRRRLS